jgi:hypothetical protein
MQVLERFGPIESSSRAVGKAWHMSVLTIRMIWNVARATSR